MTTTTLPPRAEPTTVEKLRGLPWSIAGDTANTVFAQFIFFGSVFILFLDKLGLNKTQIGSLLSLIPFCGLLALVVAPVAARFGVKRTFVSFFGLRNVVAAGLLFTPWVVASYGANVGMLYVAGITAGFALCKAISDTAAYPWVQEYIPDSVRGKYYASSNLFTTLAAFAAVTMAGLVINWFMGLTGFMLLIGAGIVAGFVSVYSYSRVPGGAAQQAALMNGKKLLAVLGDRNFLRYMLGVSLIVVGFVPLLSFLPLFMYEQVGLNDSQVVLLQTGNLAGGLLAGYLWGWASDRYGSKPVMMSGLFIRLLLPLLWFAMPRHAEWSFAVAFVIALLQGFGDVGWAIGSARLLFVNVVPAEKSMEYMALYYAGIGLISGLSQLWGGFILDLTNGIHWQLGFFTIDPYTLLMATALLLTLWSIAIFRNVRGDSPVSLGQFANLFIRGNPFKAFETVFRYYLARDERAMVFMTARLGQSQSHLAVDELLDALRDPRFAVRFEAIVAISRMPPDPRLTDELIKVLEGKSPALSVIAAWALGRSDDPRAVEPLRRALHSPYRSIQSHAARSLATLGDQATAELLLARVTDEPDYGLQVAYASALGKLGTEQSLTTLLKLLREADDESTQWELALAVARVVGHEDYFIRLLRQVRGESGTALAQALAPLKRKLLSLTRQQPGQPNLLDEATDALARQELTRGATLLGQWIDQLPLTTLPANAASVLQECAVRLAELSATRLEYLLLVLHTLQVTDYEVRVTKK